MIHAAIEGMRRLVLSVVAVIATLPAGVGSAAPGLPRAPSTSPPDVVRIVVDSKGDGFALGACSASTKHRGPVADSDDRLLAVDVAAAGKLGYRIAPLLGALGSAAPVGTNVRITPPTGTPFEPSSGWEMFRILDANKDGVLDASDLTWPALRVARDLDGDGLLDGAEVEPLASADIRRLGPRSIEPRVRDAYQNELWKGTFTRYDTSLGSLADVRLALCDPRPGSRLALAR